MAASTSLRVGADFSTLESLLAAINEFQNEQKVSYWRRDSRTLKAAKNRGMDVPLNDEIKYYELRFSCIKGGRDYKSSSSGKRPRQRNTQSSIEELLVDEAAVAEEIVQQVEFDETINANIEALDTIRSYTLINENYEAALTALKDKYGNTDRLIEAHIEEILELKSQSNGLTLRQIYDKLLLLVCTLENLGVTRNQYAILLVPMLKSVFSKEIKLNWAKFERLAKTQSYKEGDPTMDRLTLFLNFLKDEVEIYECASSHHLSSQKTPQNKKIQFKEFKPTAIFQSTQNSIKPKYKAPFMKAYPPCPFCIKQHHPDKCSEAFKHDPDSAQKLIRDANRCFRCLGLHHMAECRSDRPCHICGDLHHVILCKFRKPKPLEPLSFQWNTTTKPLDNSFHQVRAERPTSSNQNQVSFQTSIEQPPSSAALLLTPTKTNVVLQTSTVHISNQNETLLVRCLMDSGSQRTYITKDIADRLSLTPIRHEYISLETFGGNTTVPSQIAVVKIVLNSRFHSKKYILEALVIDKISDSSFKTIPNDFLNYYKQLMHINELADSPEYSHMGIDVLIGIDYYWTIVGTHVLKGPHGMPSAVSSTFGWLISGPNPLDTEHQPVSSFRVSIVDAVAKFWELESIGVSASDNRSCDELANQLFAESICKTQGKYQVGLPWKLNHPILISNKSNAQKRLNRLERKLATNQELSIAYHQALDEFIHCNYIEEVLPDNKTERYIEYYLPHRPVVKEGSTFKVRPVFDASAKDSNGHSLNDCLLTGPSLLPQLSDIVLRFRQWKFGFTADIKRAFLQILIQPNDRDVLRLLWNNKTYRFTRVPFGVLSSPFLLNATIRHHLESCTLSDSEIQSHLLDDLHSNFYMDDYISGADTQADVTDMTKGATDIMRSAGMEFREWNGNCPSLNVLKQQCNVLGISWDCQKDYLSLQPLKEKFIRQPVSKRNVLAFISQTFDPLGFLSPVIIKGKILMQKLWKLSLGWDQPITDCYLLNEIKSIVQDLQKVEQLEIPRCYFRRQLDIVSLHVFCDASKSAYSAVVYVTSDSEASIVISKTRVSPLKEVSLPKLELLGCLIGARLIARIRNIVPKFKQANCYCWTDSTIALAWLKTPIDISGSRNIFVTNRVKEIQSLTENMCGGMVLVGLLNLPLIGLILFHVFRQNVLTLLTLVYPLKLQVMTLSNLCLTLVQLSRLGHVLRVTAYVLRWTSKIKLPTGSRTLTTIERNVCVPSVDKLERARIYWIKYVQNFKFEEDLQNLRKSKKCKLSHLGPVIDSCGLLRSVGRTHRVHSSNPIILPPNSELTRLIVLDYHERLFHAGVTLTLAEIRSKYWIIRGRQTIKRTINQCLVCKRHKVLPYLQLPSALPEWRLAERPPFSASGIDFCGPFNTTEGKTYILLFTCCSTRAIHLEVTSDMSATSVINAIRRFISRRGKLDFIISDNAKSFIKARQSLAHIKWVMIPERAPWWGGFWERLVRSVKNAFKLGIGRSCLTFEDMRTIVPEIESVINKRPITYISEDRDDPKPLRPVDFLLTTEDLPSIIHSSPQEELIGHWKHRQIIIKNVWKRWRTEYLSELHRWTKFPFGKGLPQVGDVVLVNPLNVKNRAFFPLGMITKLIPGKDGHVRAAYVRVQGKMLRRTTRHLYPLETKGVIVCEPSVSTSDSILGSRSVELPKDLAVSQRKTRSGRVIIRPSRFKDSEYTYRAGCESFVQIRYSKESQKLVIVNLNLEHNHDVTEETYQFLPKCRRLDEKERTEVEKILKTKSNKKIIQNHIRQSFRKSVTLKDLINMSANIDSCSDDLEEILSDISSSKDKTFEVVTDETDTLRAIYYQDNVMKEKFTRYPEVIMCNSTYKLNNFRMPVIITVVVDGNGETEIVAVYIVVTDDKDTLKCLLDMFKQHNPAWTEIKTVLTDKDMTERSVFLEVMPLIKLQLCLSQVLKAMRREIHCEKLGIRIEEKNRCLEIIRKIAYSNSEDEYSDNVQTLKDTNIQPVIEYFEESWHDIHTEWVIGLMEPCHFNNNTTNRVENINQKLRQVITKFSNLKSFFRDLDVLIMCLRQERDSRIANLLVKRRLGPYPSGSAQAIYMELLTPYAYQIVVQQIQLAEKVKVPALDDNDNVSMQTNFGEVSVTVDSCSCKFVEFNRLPCLHIFALRLKMNMHLYTGVAVSNRWKLAEYSSAFHVTEARPLGNDNYPVDASVASTSLQRPVLTQSQKYKSAFNVAQKLAILASEGSMNLYTQRIQVLNDLLKVWDEGSQGTVGNIENMVLASSISAASSDCSDTSDSHPEKVICTPTGTQQKKCGLQFPRVGAGISDASHAVIDPQTPKFPLSSWQALP
ncbi:Zinc finger SWIM domain-containing protein 3 [Nymphon striatum]|nr:Zinc finger SWIM domain-containing protein 3 [Nymphon striatum]